MGEIRARLVEKASSTELAGAQKLIAESEQTIKEVRQRLYSGLYTVKVNDLLASYNELRQRLSSPQIRISETFGSNSEPTGPPVYPVITFGRGIEGEAITRVCQLLSNLTERFINTNSIDISAGTFYVGAYGYGGQNLAPLDSRLLAEMSQPALSRARLERVATDSAVLSVGLSLNANPLVNCGGIIAHEKSPRSEMR